MPLRAILVDLDDTLLVEKKSADEAFLAAARYLAERYAGIDAEDFAETARQTARRVWGEMPSKPYCREIGISSREGLWAEFSDLNPHQSMLKSLKEQYRLTAWGNSLMEYGIDDPVLAGELSRVFIAERRDRHVLFPDSVPFLEDVRGMYRLALVTNGTPDVQRRKIDGSGLAGYFDHIVVSGEVGYAKPHAAIFSSALDMLGMQKDEAVMIGDMLKTDILGANKSGITSIYVNRDGNINDTGISPVMEFSGLQDIPAVLLEY